MFSIFTNVLSRDTHSEPGLPMGTLAEFGTVAEYSFGSQANC